MNRHTKNKADPLLSDWDESSNESYLRERHRFEQRRNFLRSTLNSGVALSCLPVFAGLSACDRKVQQQDIIQQHPWQTFAAVQQQLFPDDGNGPSASDINAGLYLKFVLEAPDTEDTDKKFLHDGIQWLNALTDKDFGQPFVNLSLSKQAEALSKIASSQAGERWLSQLILYLIEALLSDPVYGGNPNSIGWKWLEHQPGFPRPSRDKRYIKLL